MESTSCVSRTIEILGTGVAEIDDFGVDDGAVAWFGFVVDYRSVGAGGGDGVEREACKMLLFSGRNNSILKSSRKKVQRW